MLEQLMWTDYILLLIIFASTLLSIRKGFFEELFSIFSLGTAIIISFKYSNSLASSFNSLIGEDALSPSVSMIGLFFFVYILLSRLTRRMIKYIRKYKVGVFDKLLGIVFGFARGVFVAAIFVAFALFAPYVKSDSWLHTPVASGLYPLSDSLMVYLPDDIEKMIKGQVKDFEGSEFVNQTKKLMNVAFDAELELKDPNQPEQAPQDTQKTPEQLKAEQQQQLKELQKARLYREKMSQGSLKSDLQRPANPKVNSENLQNRIFQKHTGLGTIPKSDRATLLLKQKELEEQKQIEEMKKHHEDIIKEKKSN